MKDNAFTTRLFFGLILVSYVILYGLIALVS
jgi:hypothetical protein